MSQSKREKFLDVRLPIGRIALRQQHHDVDVRAGVQFAAAIAADRDQRQVLGESAGMALPGRAQRDVDEPRAIAHQLLDVSSAAKRSAAARCRARALGGTPAGKTGCLSSASGATLR
jgi:hypothetical protein